jgi:hypothetical protein
VINARATEIVDGEILKKALEKAQGSSSKAAAAAAEHTIAEHSIRLTIAWHSICDSQRSSTERKGLWLTRESLLLPPLLLLQSRP